jgi:hypothetical protein
MVAVVSVWQRRVEDPQGSGERRLAREYRRWVQTKATNLAQAGPSGLSVHRGSST